MDSTKVHLAPIWNRLSYGELAPRTAGLPYSKVPNMFTPKMPLNDTKTLAHRLGEERLPVAEALQYAMQLAESLTRLREAGKAHGAVTPANLALVAGGVELLTPSQESPAAITPYTAPEVVLGGAADARSDIFSFGAILFEMLTGRRAFNGQNRDTPSSGNPALDRLVGPCLDSDPDARSARIQKVMMELKLLSVAARRTGMGVAGGLGHETASEAILARIDRGFEALNARMEQIERTVEAMACMLPGWSTGWQPTWWTLNRASRFNPQRSNRHARRCRRPTIWWSAWWKCWNRCKPRCWNRQKAMNVLSLPSTAKESVRTAEV